MTLVLCRLAMDMEKTRKMIPLRCVRLRMMTLRWLQWIFKIASADLKISLPPTQYRCAIYMNLQGSHTLH